MSHALDSGENNGRSIQDSTEIFISIFKQQKMGGSTVGNNTMDDEVP